MPSLPHLPDLHLPMLPPSLPELDALQTYLVVVNVASLLLHALHYVQLRTTGEERVAEPVRNLLTVSGGVGGTLLSYLIWDRRTVKENAWPHVLAVVAAIGWGVALSFVYVQPLDPGGFVERLRASHDVRLAYWLAAITAVTFVAFGIDKWLAATGRRRVPEAVLLGLSLAGGTVGGLVGMTLFRHKIRSTQFAWGLPLLLLAQLALVAYLLNAGMV